MPLLSISNAKSILLFSFLTCLVFIGTCAQSETHREISIQSDVVYGRKAGMALTYDVLAPAEHNGAAVLFIVSGGWRSSWAPPEIMIGMFEFLLDEGFIVIAVRHGSSPRFNVPEAVADVRRAVRHIRFNAKHNQINPDRIGVWGQSAGGQLSLMLGLAGDDGDGSSEDPVERTSNRVSAVVAYYPLTDLRGLSGPNERVPAFDFKAEEEPNVSPILFVSEDDPPVLLVHGDEDSIVPIEHSHNLHQAMQEMSLEVKFVTIEGANHSFDGEDFYTVRNLTKEFFVTHLID